VTAKQKGVCRYGYGYWYGYRKSVQTTIQVNNLRDLLTRPHAYVLSCFPPLLLLSFFSFLPATLDPTRGGMVASAGPGAAHAASAATGAAGQEADEDVEERDDATDDGLQDAADAVHDGHQHVADGPEEALDTTEYGTHLECWLWNRGGGLSLLCEVCLCSFVVEMLGFLVFFSY